MGHIIILSDGVVSYLIIPAMQTATAAEFSARIYRGHSGSVIPTAANDPFIKRPIPQSILMSLSSICFAVLQSVGFALDGLAQ